MTSPNPAGRRMVATTGMGTDGRQADSLDNDQLSVLAMTDALAQLGPLRTVLGDLVALVEANHVSSQLSGLPKKLLFAKNRCTSIHKQLSEARSRVEDARAKRTSDASVSARTEFKAASTQTSKQTQMLSPVRSHVVLQPQQSPRSASPSPRQPSPTQSSPRRQSSPTQPSPRPPSPRKPPVPRLSSPRSVTPLEGIADGDSANGSGAPSGATSSRKSILPLSRWPESELEPREAKSQREIAIKDDVDHPLRVMYVKAPSHWESDPSASEITGRHCLKEAMSVQMLGPKSRRANFLKLVFLMWAGHTVGNEGKRDRVIKLCTNRRREVRVSCLCATALTVCVADMPRSWRAAAVLLAR